ncbi:hypothetical protein G6F57_017875 [Rhizopus arrhizus]|nr:hypothetical protein G6F57_017875 [Rhizopus arrhizus]
MAVDTGFIVFNPLHYPLLTALFDELGVASQPTTMSFSLHSERSGVEYNATSLDGLFCQRRNLLSPRFWGMLADLRRFYRDAPLLLGEDEGPTLGQYLHAQRYGQAFIEEHLLPMASALWSSPTRSVMEFPARYLAQFMANHQMLQVSERPEWRVVQGGSSTYIRAMRQRRQAWWSPRPTASRITTKWSSPATAIRPSSCWRTPHLPNARCWARFPTTTTTWCCTPTPASCPIDARPGPPGTPTYRRIRPRPVPSATA